MNKTPVLTALSAQSANPSHDDPIDRALNLLASGGFDFQVMDRCPAACEFCDDGLERAA